MTTGLRLWLGGLALVAQAAMADTPLAELNLLAEQPVDGMSRGNLSGLAWCGGALWAVSDRDDDRLYRLASGASVWQAQAEVFNAPPAPSSGLSWGLRMRNWAASLLRGGSLDFEGLSCDAAGNRYLVSESQVAVLKLSAQGEASWLRLEPGLLHQARVKGMLWKFNALLEGIAIDPPGEHLWLAAERQHRGLLELNKQQDHWSCDSRCVLLSEGGELAAPAALGGELFARDFSDLVFFHGKLFTLERLAHQICRRTPEDGRVEQCWSYAAAALTPERRYPQAYGMAEALWIDADGAWIGVDNGEQARADGESRPIIWRFAAPSGGWEAP